MGFWVLVWSFYPKCKNSFLYQHSRKRIKQLFIGSCLILFLLRFLQNWVDYFKFLCFFLIFLIFFESYKKNYRNFKEKTSKKFKRILNFFDVFSLKKKAKKKRRKWIKTQTCFVLNLWLEFFFVYYRINFSDFIWLLKCFCGIWTQFSLHFFWLWFAIIWLTLFSNCNSHCIYTRLFKC